MITAPTEKIGRHKLLEAVPVGEISQARLTKLFASSSDDATYLELVREIQKHGLQRPIGVSTKGELIFGRRRLRAVKQLGGTYIQCYVFDLQAIANLRGKKLESCKLLEATENAALAEALRPYFVGVGSRGAQDIAGGIVGLGGSTNCCYLNKVLRRSPREVCNAIDAGRMSVPQAYRHTDLSEQEQVDEAEGRLVMPVRGKAAQGSRTKAQTFTSSRTAKRKSEDCENAMAELDMIYTAIRDFKNKIAKTGGKFKHHQFDLEGCQKRLSLASTLIITTRNSIRGE